MGPMGLTMGRWHHRGGAVGLQNAARMVRAKVGHRSSLSITKWVTKWVTGWVQSGSQSGSQSQSYGYRRKPYGIMREPCGNHREPCGSLIHPAAKTITYKTYSISSMSKRALGNVFEFCGHPGDGPHENSPNNGSHCCEEGEEVTSSSGGPLRW